MRPTQQQIRTDLISQLEASNRTIELLVECYMTGKKLSWVEALQVQTCSDDNKVYIAQH